METCSIDGCDKAKYSKGYCNSHYGRYKDGRDMNAPFKPKRPTHCSIDGCNRKHQGLGFCSMHYHRHKKGMKDMRPEPLVAPNGQRHTKPCSIDGCEKVMRLFGMCTRHASRVKKGITDMRPGKIAPGLKIGEKRKPYGHQYITATGYIWIVVDPKLSFGQESKAGYMAEHRYIMSRHLGRALLTHENIHHINGVRDDNRLENLELWDTSQPNGGRLTDKIKWWKESLEQYGFEVIPPDKKMY